VYTSSASASPTAPSASSHSGGHAGAIAGGVTGSIAVISIAVAAIIFYLRRRRSQAALTSAGVGASQAMSADRAVVQSSLELPLAMRLYVRDFKSHAAAISYHFRILTFPGYPGGSRSMDIPPASQVVPFSSHFESGSSLADVQTLPRPGVYRGLPMPSA
jgi:hypothetical protein